MSHPALTAYLSKTAPESIDTGFLGYIANLAETAKMALTEILRPAQNDIAQGEL